MSRKRKIFLILLVAVPLAAVFVVLFWPKTPATPPQIIKLPNGVVYQLAAVTYGTNHVVGTTASKIIHGLSAPIEKFARKILGSSFPAVQGARTTPQPALCVWFNVTSSNTLPPMGTTITPSVLNQIVPRLADENGMESGAQSTIMFPLSAVVARFVEFPVLPRRSRTIQIRLYEADTQNRILQELGSFKFPNPIYGKFPQWTPDTGPLVRKAGDLEVRLDKFQVGKRLPRTPITLANGQLASVYGNVHNGERAETVFDTSLNSPEGDGTNSPWLLQNAVLSDATGNALDNSLTFFMASVSDGRRIGLSPMDGLGTSRRTLPGAFWPNESAWKLRLDFKRTTGFDTNELVTFRNVPVPAPGATNNPGLRLRVGDAQVTLAEFTRNRIPTAAEEEAIRLGKAPLIGNPATPTRFRFEITGRRDGLAVDFVRLTDAASDEPQLTFNSWQPGVRVIGLTDLSTNTQTVDITLSVQRCRTVEFLLKPPPM